jgi:hypothetical protein
MNTPTPNPGDAALRAAFRRVALASLMAAVAACGGGGGTGDASSAAPPPAPAPAPAPAGMVRITLELDAPAALYPGTVYLRSGNSATTRAAMTRQDVNCSPVGTGPKSCTFTVPKGETVTLVANDQQSQISFGSVVIVSQRNVDPRGIRSQFVAFGAPCATPERGVCVITATADQTISAQYTGLTWTRVNFIGLVNWRITLNAPPTLAIASDLRTADQNEVWTPDTASVAECSTAAAQTHCYNILTPAGGTINFEALPPKPPTPLGSTGPLAFVGYDGACQINGANPNCPLTSGVDQIATMKWEYYDCGIGGASNPRWKFNPPPSGCTLARP